MAHGTLYCQDWIRSTWMAAPNVAVKRYQRLLAMARRLPPVATAVVHPCDAVSLAGAVEAYRLGLIAPILVAPPARLADLARQNGIDISGLPVVASEHSHDFGGQGRGPGARG